MWNFLTSPDRRPVYNRSSIYRTEGPCSTRGTNFPSLLRLWKKNLSRWLRVHYHRMFLEGWRKENPGQVMAAMIPTPTSTRVLLRSWNMVLPHPLHFPSLLQDTIWKHHLQQRLLRPVPDIILPNLRSRQTTISFLPFASRSPPVLAYCSVEKASVDLLRSRVYSPLLDLSIREKWSKRRRRKGGALAPFRESLE